MSDQRLQARSPLTLDLDSDDEELPNASMVSLPFDSDAPSYSGKAPLTQNAAAPAGHGQGQLGDPARNMSMMDDDEEMLQARARLAAMQAKRHRQPSKRFAGLVAEVKRLMKGGPKVYEGERLIHIGNPARNAESKFPGNSVSTSKYNVITFLPKFLAGRPSTRVIIVRRG